MENKFINENLILDNCGRISWKNSIGKIFSVVYEDVKYTFIITKYNSKNRKINFKYYFKFILTVDFKWNCPKWNESFRSND